MKFLDNPKLMSEKERAIFVQATMESEFFKEHNFSEKQWVSNIDFLIKKTDFNLFQIYYVMNSKNVSFACNFSKGHGKVIENYFRRSFLASIVIFSDDVKKEKKDEFSGKQKNIEKVLYVKSRVFPNLIGTEDEMKKEEIAFKKRVVKPIKELHALERIKRSSPIKFEKKKVMRF